MATAFDSPAVYPLKLPSSGPIMISSVSVAQMEVLVGTIGRHLFRPWVARTIAVSSAVYTVYYLLWRWNSTLNPDALAFSGLLLAAEAVGFLTFLLFAFMTWDVGRNARFSLGNGLSVDVFVPTYDEGLDILEATLTGCQAIRYPHITYVLDDGRRPDVQALAQRLGCRYLTRESNTHAKAGNLNAALPRTGGDFIAIFDADTVPQPDFLDKTLGYFSDERVALVQLPQEFYNVDSVQHIREEKAAAPWHEQALFYRVIQPGKNRWNAAFWCGSPSIVRRAALLDAGGVATETVTEDIHTSIRLHRRGWKTVYHKETLAFGIAPQTMVAFGVQRLRWAQGTMQILRSRENPLIIPGLSLAQRLNYFASMFTYFESYQKLVYLLTPSIILLTGILPLQIGAIPFLVRWSVYFALSGLANVALGRGNYRYLKVEEFNLLKIFIFLWASTTLLWSRRLSFKVTPKATAQSLDAREWRPVLMHIVVAGLVLTSIVVGVANLVWRFTVDYARTDIILGTIFWAFVSCGLISFTVRSVITRLHRRQSYRFPVELLVEVADPEGARALALTSDISQHGIALVMKPQNRADSTVRELQLGDRITVNLRVLEGLIGLDAEVTRTSKEPDGQQTVGAHFLPMAWPRRRDLLRFLFVTLPRAIHSAGFPPDGPHIERRTAPGNGSHVATS